MVEIKPRQKAFAEAYVQTSNASEAYRRAYPNANAWTQPAVAVAASRLLANTNVTLMVEQLQAEAQKRHEVTLETIIADLKFDRDGARKSEQWAAAIKATETIARYHGIEPPDKLEITGKGGGPVRTESTDAFLGEMAKLRKRVEETEIEE